MTVLQKSKYYILYLLELMELTITCKFKAFDQLVICNNISSVRDCPGLNELKKPKIEV